MFNYKRFETISKLVTEKFSFVDKGHESLLLDLTTIIILLEKDLTSELNEEQLVKIIIIGIESLVFNMGSLFQEEKSIEGKFASLMVLVYLKNNLDNARFNRKNSGKSNSDLTKEETSK